VQHDERRPNASTLVGDPHPTDVDLIHNAILSQAQRVHAEGSERGRIYSAPTSRRERAPWSAVVQILPPDVRKTEPGQR
jgi:hypothetical protein